MATVFHICKPGSESLCARELKGEGSEVLEAGPGWIRCGPLPDERALLSEPFGPAGLCFPVVSILDAADLHAGSVNAQAAALARRFWEAHRGERLETRWWFELTGPPDRELTARLRSVRRELKKRLTRQAPRVARLAMTDIPETPAVQRGFAVWFHDFEKLTAGGRFCHWGQRRMRDDRAAPSRSFLKVEEAYAVLGQAPTAGETVADLGAAPGGWSFSAARRGARVIAVDNGPLKGGARDHPLIEHAPVDAFRFRPPAGQRFDWLFCDLIENPERVLTEILLPWLVKRWCRRFVVNLKTGKADPVRLARELRRPGPASPLSHCAEFRVRHLYHDREEITCVGRLFDLP